jgi:aspartate carbamoyltransferase catalytic subunit
MKIAIVGDVAHSRVARSALWAFTRLGAHVTLCGPTALLPADASALGDRAAAAACAPAQARGRGRGRRRGDGAAPPGRAHGEGEPAERRRLRAALPADRQALAGAAKDVLVLHPGPMNRGVEIASHVADSPKSLIREQVANGVAVRMAVLCWCRGLDPVEAAS